jgi:predicted Zn-ribbon and HTH transcriptional regulator
MADTTIRVAAHLEIAQEYERRIAELTRRLELDWWECPECGFTMDSGNASDPSEGPSVEDCPRCECDRLKERVAELENNQRCPECKCATSQDAEASECGCDAPVCAREGALGEAYSTVHKDREQLKERVAELEAAQTAAEKGGA